MLSNNHRFHGHNTVRQVYHVGKVVRSGFGSVHYRVNDKRRTYRASVVVSKKVNKSAVARNRIRRRVYEILRLQSPQFHRPFDIVLTIHTEQAATMPAPELQENVLGLLSQAHILEK
jgi:ribonuclease P protein component